jgi:hypothetical protein
VGDLVTCSRCVGIWVAPRVAGIDVLTPHIDRTLSWARAVGGANDFLRAGFSALTGAANGVQAD